MEIEHSEDDTHEFSTTRSAKRCWFAAQLKQSRLWLVERSDACAESAADRVIIRKF